jgi:hypothetical protein
MSRNQQKRDSIESQVKANYDKTKKCKSEQKRKEKNRAQQSRAKQDRQSKDVAGLLKR